MSEERVGRYQEPSAFNLQPPGRDQRVGWFRRLLRFVLSCGGRDRL